MLVSSFNLSQSFNYTTPYLFYKKTVQIRDQFFLCMDQGDNFPKWDRRNDALLYTAAEEGKGSQSTTVIWL